MIPHIFSIGFQSGWWGGSLITVSVLSEQSIAEVSYCGLCIFMRSYSSAFVMSELYHTPCLSNQNNISPFLALLVGCQLSCTLCHDTLSTTITDPIPNLEWASPATISYNLHGNLHFLNQIGILKEHWVWNLAKKKKKNQFI
jgi:hypothetical protein